MANKTKIEEKKLEVKPIVQPVAAPIVVPKNKTIELTEKEITALRKAKEIAIAGFPPSGLKETLEGIIAKL